MAKMLGVSSRTLRQWSTSCSSEPKKPGRKKVETSFFELLAIAREWKKQGRPGSRPVANALPKMRVRVVREVIAELKKRSERRYQKIRLQNRSSLVVKQIGIVGAMDAATIQKGDEFIVYRDRASLGVSTLNSDSYTNSSDSLKILWNLKEKDKLPFVLCTDNGSPFCSDVVASFLKENKVIQLHSLPYVPQHNGSAENAVCEIKKILDQGMNPQEACELLNKYRFRSKLGWKTSYEVEQEHAKPCTNEERTKFYEAACIAIELAVQGKKSSCEIRKFRREAIFQTLESFSLATRIKGHLTPSLKAEAIT